MAKPVIGVYADTSVFGGVFDEEFRAASRTFFDQVRDGRFRLVVSALLQEEIAAAPPQVRQFSQGLLGIAEVATVTPEALQLRAAYLQAGIVSPQWAADALHVALATTSGASLIVSWNFAHIVHFGKIRLYNAANSLSGYGSIAIHSPQEVISYEEEV